ncbi:MAG: fimbrial protein [Fibrobacter sp.]|nr:fimbrial protein [Fibrobacter sp.]
MKNAFNTILLLTLVGFAVLVAGAFYFGAPLFGWIIMIAIFAVFVVEQVIALSKLKQVGLEDELIEKCETSKTFNVTGDGVVASRLKMARELMQKGIRLDSPIAYEVLSNGSSVNVPRSSSGTVILLGLMGTFFGLMSSIATAGGAMDNSTTQGTLETIQVLFQNMKGIFGTSLCGLFAALILNASRNLLIARRDAFMARLDGLTLEMQGDSSESGDSDKSEMERLFGMVSESLVKMTSSVQQELSSIVNKVGETLSQSSAKMIADVSASFAPMESNFKSLSATVESIPAKLQQSLDGVGTQVGGIANAVQQSLGGVGTTVRESLGGVGDSVRESLSGVGDVVKQSLGGVGGEIAASVETQVKQSNEQWKAFMDRLASESTESVNAQREGLENLKNVALQVAEKAQAGSAELSQSVAEKLGTLSNDILAAFQKLSETSSVLLEAQKALTESIDNRVVKEKEATDALGGNIVETAELMRVNQSELSANLEMLRAGLETILEKLSGDTAEHEEEDNFVEHLNQSLEAFHERASEVLMENAVKTQEILLEVMEQTQRANIAQQPKVEG